MTLLGSIFETEEEVQVTTDCAVQKVQVKSAAVTSGHGRGH